MISLLVFVQIVSFSLGLASFIVSAILLIKYRDKTVLYYTAFLLIFSIRMFLSSLLFSIRLDQSFYYGTVLIFYVLTKDICRLLLFFIPIMLMHLLSVRFEKTGKIVISALTLLSAAALSVPYFFAGKIAGGALLFSIMDWVTPGALIITGLLMPFLTVLYRRKISNNVFVKSLVPVVLIFFYGFILFDWISGRSSGGFLSRSNIKEIIFQLSGYFLINFFFLFLTVRFFLRYSRKEAIAEPDSVFFSKFNITEREQEILLLILQGLNSREIADKLFISQKTVKNHIHHIYGKTGINSRLELAFLIRSGRKPVF